MSEPLQVALISAVAAIIGGTFYGLAVGVVNLFAYRKLRAAETDAKQLENEEKRLVLAAKAEMSHIELAEEFQPKSKRKGKP